jgi:ferric-dicitrate binding protein FerR (iron transport regulator)
MKRISKKDLLERYALGQCSEEEALWVEKWYIKQEDDLPLPISRGEFREDIKEIYSNLHPQERKVTRRYPMKIAAALIGMFLAIGIFIHFYKQQAISEKAIVAQDISPSLNKTTLLLSNGSMILLDELNVGKVFQDNNSRIIKSEKGQIEYVGGKGKNGCVFYNEMHTSEGGQYLVILSDGSKVWLNAASKLRYPTQFEGSKRMVELSGEAYFEVAKQTIPFYVKTDQQEIEVLGTSFNVKAYENEDNIRTTLLEGSVKIVAKQVSDEVNSVELLLKPGEQAVLNQKEGSKVLTVNARQSIAWRNGLFSFQGEDLKSVMREISRWYGVEVKFEGEVPDTKLWGQVYRNVNASQALKVLEYFDLSFKIVKDKGISKIEISEK